MRRACIDIGSNTIRLLVAECERGQLLEVHQERSFTRIGRGIDASGAIREEKIAEAADVVAAQADGARELGCREIHAVATAAVRHACNGEALAKRVTETAGVTVRILSGEEEARLAFRGAAGMLEHEPEGAFAVIDVGGGSSELIAGTLVGGVAWCESFPVGSGVVADRMLCSEPPSEKELTRARRHVGSVISVRTPPPTVSEAVAVGGSATSLHRLAGPRLDQRAFQRAFELLRREPALELARRYALDLERIRLLPAGLVILEAAARVFGVPLTIGRGGLREGVLLEAAGLA